MRILSLFELLLVVFTHYAIPGIVSTLESLRKQW
jgi:hypothetical protein